MNRINRLFSHADKKLLSVYFCAGYPTADSTAGIIRALENRGIDLIEIGIPFSDPMADGEVIQHAATQALRNGMSLKRLFGQLSDIRKTVEIPLILMGYLNPVLRFGFENFCRKCVECGIDGCIIPDLPFQEYQQHYRSIAERYGLKVIMLITPETSDERIRLIDSNTDGFIYMVSSSATTGAQQDFDARKQDYFRRIDAMRLRNPRMIGFGISNRATLQAAYDHASGAIIGSKFVSLLGETIRRSKRSNACWKHSKNKRSGKRTISRATELLFARPIVLPVRTGARSPYGRTRAPSVHPTLQMPRA